MVKALGKVTVLLAFALAASAQQDPPSRVARLNYMSGNVAMQPAGIDDWGPAVVNRPFTSGDYLYTDEGARAELHLDIAAMRIGPQTSFGFLNLNDQTVQIRLSEGDMYFRLHNFGADQVFEVDTPNAAVTLLRDGVYRFRVDPNGSFSFIVVRQGQAEITGGGQAFTLNPGNSANITGTDQLAFDVEVAPGADEFDNWCAQRDAREARLASARYLPPTMIGYEDLDDYGSWEEAADYGPVWYPRTVVVGWAPYHDGHWAWIEPWGWTWVDAAPWGFAPFHYGRWAYIHNRWGWCPGPIAVVGYRAPVIRPVYAPALVAWFGGAHWGVSVSVGGPSVGWVPLGFGEVYTPHYACSRGYFNNVNVHNTRIVNTVNITNVYNTVYVNHAVYNREFVNVRAPNAVMAMPQSGFAAGRLVREGGFAVRPGDVGRIQANAVVVAPPVVPTREALAPTAGRTVARPPSQVFQRQVIARNAPPPQPVSFSARQSYLQQHVGQPHNFEAMHQAVAAQPHAAAYVRQVPAGQPAPARPGERGGSPGGFRTEPQPGYRQPVQPAAPAQPATMPARRDLPPNLRQGNNSQPTQYQPPVQHNVNPDPRFTERSQPAARPAERTMPNERKNAERSQTPQPAPPSQPVRPHVEERSQPVNPPVSQPRNEPPPRPAPQPRQEVRPAPAPAPQRQERQAQPAQRQERKEDHKDDHKDH